MVWRRTPLIRIGGLEEVEDYVTEFGPGVTLIVDVDNTVVPQGAEGSEFRDQVNRSLDRLARHPGVEQVIGLTNGPPRGVERLAESGNKPWTSRERLGLPTGTSSPLVVVVGDQVLTDGLLAWRLGATHLHLVVDRETEPARQAWLRRLGRPLELLLFRKERWDRRR